MWIQREWTVMIDPGIAKPIAAIIIVVVLFQWAWRFFLLQLGLMLEKTESDRFWPLLETGLRVLPTALYLAGVWMMLDLFPFADRHERL